MLTILILFSLYLDMLSQVIFKMKCEIYILRKSKARLLIFLKKLNFKVLGSVPKCRQPVGFRSGHLADGWLHLLRRTSVSVTPRTAGQDVHRAGWGGSSCECAKPVDSCIGIYQLYYFPYKRLQTHFRPTLYCFV